MNRTQDPSRTNGDAEGFGEGFVSSLAESRSFAEQLSSVHILLADDKTAESHTTIKMIHQASKQVYCFGCFSHSCCFLLSIIFMLLFFSSTVGVINLDVEKRHCLHGCPGNILKASTSWMFDDPSWEHFGKSPVYRWPTNPTKLRRSAILIGMALISPCLLC